MRCLKQNGAILTFLAPSTIQNSVPISIESVLNLLFLLIYPQINIIINSKQIKIDFFTGKDLFSLLWRQNATRVRISTAEDDLFS